MVKNITKKITLDDFAAMCMREFTSIHKMMNTRFDRIEIRMDRAEKRLQNISEIVLDDHHPRIIDLEKEVFLR